MKRPIVRRDVMRALNLEGTGVRIHDDDKDKFETLDDQRRRIDDEFNEIVQQMRSGVVRDDDKLRIEAQHLHVRHQGIIRQMIDLLVYG
ncbi:MAG TPA: hypothetical protein VFY10_01185 [Dehalococcoidia bacterium]|nr:hypothetical protein [Dehalococcoidia bacterium]